MENEFMAHLGEKTITLTEDEVATLGTLIGCVRVARLFSRAMENVELALEEAMPVLDKVADPYE